MKTYLMYARRPWNMRCIIRLSPYQISLFGHCWKFLFSKCKCKWKWNWSSTWPIRVSSSEIKANCTESTWIEHTSETHEFHLLVVIFQTSQFGGNVERVKVNVMAQLVIRLKYTSAGCALFNLFIQWSDIWTSLVRNAFGRRLPPIYYIEMVEIIATFPTTPPTNETNNNSLLNWALYK